MCRESYLAALDALYDARDVIRLITTRHDPEAITSRTTLTAIRTAARARQRK